MEFVFGGAADPAGHGAVFGVGAAADLVEEFGGEPDGDEFGESSVAAAGWALGLLVFCLGVEGVFLVGGHGGGFGLVGHRSSR